MDLFNITISVNWETLEKIAQLFRGECPEEEVEGVEPFGERIRKKREELKIPQSILAERAGIHLSTLVKIESGKSSAWLATQQKLLKALEQPK